MAKRTVEDLNVTGKKVIVRVDFNVPLKDGVITDDNRIQGALPTINYLVSKGAKVILMSHLGKINFKDPAKTEGDIKKNNMAPVAARLAELVDAKVVFCPVTRGEQLEKAVAELQNGEILLVQNTRYEKGETKNDPELSAYWASLGDLYVSDAFGSLHRAHASTVGIPSILKENAVGYLVQKELTNLSMATENPKHPYVAILGGAKVSDKIGVIENLLKLADKILIGGGMAYTFKVAQGYTVGNSLLEEDKVEIAKEFLARANGKIILPVDNVIADAFSEDANTQVVEGNIPEGWQGLDIGPKTVELFAKELEGAKTVVWNGPMGVFEMPKFAVGTEKVCEAIANLEGANTIIGGGDSASAAKKLGYKEKFTHVSTGGGASLEFIEGKVLPGVAIIGEKGRKPIIVGNWKMNKTPREAEEFMKGIEEVLDGTERADFGVGAPFVDLDACVRNAKHLIIAAENCNELDSGAYTGEVSVPMLKEVGITYCIIGHSERRTYYNETDAHCAAKAKRLLADNIIPILCIGETEAQYDAGETANVIKNQLAGSLAGLTAEEVAKMVIAYEPIWAIGTGKSATKEIAEDCCKLVRDTVKALYDEATGEAVRVQYGGSVKPTNIKEYMACPDIDGALIGGASLKVDSFKEIIDAVR